MTFRVAAFAAKVIPATVLIANAVAQPRADAAQSPDWVQFNDQALFLSGGNVAWVNFARDVGPGPTDLARFEEMFRQLHESGGNAMRLWLHTTGAATPAFDGSEVVGPGEETIYDLRAILDLAMRYEIGMELCLWSFDMLRLSNGSTITDRAYDLLTDSDLLQTYIDNALIPMVDALAGHPAIIAWEIFNEAEGMSDEFGWDFNRHVPMLAIQRFVNRTAGAIHRTDTSAQVTNGIWSFHALWEGTAGKRARDPDPLTRDDLQKARVTLSEKYDHAFSPAELNAYYDKLRSAVEMNYYSDDELIAAGGDPDGTLDFYNVHYYEWAGTYYSPFHHDVERWGLDKPLVVGEFFLGGGDDGNPDETFGVPWQDLYTTLFDRGYAGALGWQWYNYPSGAEGVENWPRILENAETMAAQHPGAVDVDIGTVSDDETAPTITSAGLGRNYPNPFSLETHVAYTLPASEHVRLTVFDAIGREVVVLIDGVQPAGTHSVRFDARDLSSGTYFYRLEAGAHMSTKKMILMR